MQDPCKNKILGKKTDENVLLLRVVFNHSIQFSHTYKERCYFLFSKQYDNTVNSLTI